jgi:catechol 2,3-dioxygenase-like lactoylglutathione lyase family enzyme
LSGLAQATVAPILPSRDLDATAAFYGRLGFEVAGRYPPPGDYLILRGHGLELHFFAFPEHEPARSYAGAYVRLPEVDGLHACFAEAGLPRSGIPACCAGRQALGHAGIRPGRPRRIVDPSRREPVS